MQTANQNLETPLAAQESAAPTEGALRRALLACQQGFTLVELLIVITVIGLIGTLVTTSVMKRFDEAKINATRIQIRQLGVILDDFRRVCGFYPSTEQGLDALIKAPQGRECKNYDPEGFIKDHKVPKDAWGNDFVYEGDGSKYIIRSLGADNKPGGTGPDGDISSDDQT